MSTPSKFVDDCVTAFLMSKEPSKMSKEEKELKTLIGKLLEVNKKLQDPGMPLSFKDLQNPKVRKRVQQETADLMSSRKECLTKIEEILKSKVEIDINCQFTKFNVTYLQLAAGVQGSFELTKLLLLRNPNPNLKNDFGQTALVRADKFASNAVYKLLEEYEHVYNHQQKEK